MFDISLPLIIMYFPAVVVEVYVDILVIILALSMMTKDEQISLHIHGLVFCCVIL